MNTDPRVGRLVTQWRQFRRQGRTLTAEELCAGCPELHDAVFQQIQEISLRESVPLRATRPIEPVPDVRAGDGSKRRPGQYANGGSSINPFAPESGTLRIPGNPAVPPTYVPAPPDTRIIRGYRLVERLGEGSFGVVYKALSSGGVEVAVKEIQFTLDDAQSQRELDALELIKGLRHPYLLALHDFWVENDHLYAAMELADGTLAHRAAEGGPGGVPRPELQQIFAEAAEALDFLHQRHVLHRDIKPANILLLRGHTKVADLGLAKFNPDRVAVSQTIAGSPAYMAPETFNNEFRAEGDQYALALCYAEMRLGRPICEGANMPGVIAWHLYGKPDLEGLQPHEEKAVRKALSKNPEARFPTCQDFVRALEEPKPAQRDKTWLVAVALLATLPILALVIWRLLPRADKPAAVQPAAPMVAFVPEEHGFITPPDAQMRADGNVQYYDHILKRVGGQDVTFLLIPRIDADDPQTFYMMQDKVSNGLFKAAFKDADFQSSLAKLRQQFPQLKWDEWQRGGLRNGKEDMRADDDRLPVLRANALEAFCFARWIGGNLPTGSQWDQAAGKDVAPKAIYQDPDAPLQPGDVAVDRRAEGPMPVGAARRDVSRLGCRDMAGNGWEWTRSLDSGEIPPPTFREDLLVTIRGQSYYQKQPFSFSRDTDYKLFRQGDPAVGFRVVVEP